MKLFNPSELRRDGFILTDGHLINLNDVTYVDLSEIEQERIEVKVGSIDTPLQVTGFAALELVWLLKPGALEGRRLKFPKHSWVIHNLLGHPIMQLLAFVGLYKLAMKVHDGTVPRPAKHQKEFQALGNS